MKYNSTLLVLIGLSLIGCASTAPLPDTLNIVPPAPDVLYEIAAFSGVWEGHWWNGLDTKLVVEKIDSQKAEAIMSYGLFPGSEPSYFYFTATVISHSEIEWITPIGDRYVFTMDKSLNKIFGVMIQKKTGANLRVYLTRLKSQ